MFDPRPIHRVEARELCEQMLTAVRALPASMPQQEYLTVYEAIAVWLVGLARPVPILPTSCAFRNAIERSHAAALELLQRASPRSVVAPHEHPCPIHPSLTSPPLASSSWPSFSLSVLL